MIDPLRGAVLVFDDEADVTDTIVNSLAMFRGVEVLTSLWPDQAPWPANVQPKTVKEEPLTSAHLNGADAIVLDLKMNFRNPRDTDRSSALRRQYGEFLGFYVLDMAEKGNLLSRVFVNTGQLATMGTASPALAERLTDLVRKGSICAYTKQSINDLIARIYGVLDLKFRGYLADVKTRDRLFLVARRAAAERTEPVLILGETGTGKEGAARHIHGVGQWVLSRKSAQEPLSLTIVHCGGLTADLARDELFGHVKDAFTGATGHKVGRVLRAIARRTNRASRFNTQKGTLSNATPSERDPQVAWLIREVMQLRGPGRSAEYQNWLRGSFPDLFEERASSEDLNELDMRVKTDAPFGTLFLDEFGELDSGTQALLLRLLNDGEIQPLGYEGTIHLVDKEGRLHVRFIGATNRDDVRRVLVLSTAGTNTAGTHGLKSATPSAVKPSVAIGNEPKDESVVRHDLLQRIAQWIIELPELQADEVGTLIDLEKSHRKEFSSVEWEPSAKELLSALIAQGRIPGQRRQLRIIAARAMAHVTEQAALGATLGQTAMSVSADLLKQVLTPIRIQPERDSGNSEKDNLRSAIRALLIEKEYWVDCPEGFTWAGFLDTCGSTKLAEALLDSCCLRDGKGQWYSLTDIERAWGEVTHYRMWKAIRRETEWHQIARDKFKTIRLSGSERNAELVKKVRTICAS